MTSGPVEHSGIDLGEAARQLELAAHDAQVAYDCLGLGNVDRAHTYAITARAAGYVLKQIRGTDLVGAVRTVASGQSLYDPRPPAGVSGTGADSG